MGWGGSLGAEQGWGALAWGAGGDALQLVTAVAYRENAVRLQFSAPMKWSELQDLGDGSDPRHYTVDVVAGTVGNNGEPVRPVSVIAVVGYAGNRANGMTAVEVIVDRPLSPYPAQYTIAVEGVVTVSNETLDPNADEATFYGVHRATGPNLAGAASPQADFANPATRGMFAGSHVDPNAQAEILGTFVVDETGDYAIDSGATSYKKRVLRVCITVKGAFLHLPGWGAGVIENTKQLARPALLQQMATDAEDQIRQMPETVSVSVSFEAASGASGVYWMHVRAQSKTGETLDTRLPVSIGE